MDEVRLLSGLVRLQLSRKRGARLVSPNGLPNARVDRASKWGNPFTELRGQRARAVELFRQQLERDQAYDWKGIVTVDDIRRELQGKNLACWCSVLDGSPCHADVLLQIARET